jgi:hypothetical protein
MSVQSIAQAVSKSTTMTEIYYLAEEAGVSPVELLRAAMENLEAAA